MAHKQTDKNPPSPIFLSSTDRDVVLAVLGETDGSHLAFVPIKDAISKKLSFLFEVPPRPEKGSSLSIPLVLAGQWRFVTLPRKSTPPGYRLAHVVTFPDQNSDMIYINYNLLMYPGQDLPFGISIGGLDLNANTTILGLDADGRLGLDTGSGTIGNGTTKGYAIMGPGDERLGLDKTIKDEIDRTKASAIVHPPVERAPIKWFWLIVPPLVVACAYMLLRRSRKIANKESTRI
jgi:hypothetical protein